ncbi:Predicted PurR-regulated permease PerM [Arboricoccus pini]|uniref:Predicted PurR-regulated permease PerM n=1 Tax=Arboricoccus pini TaxID=1963835 RepID=A0A212QPJ8_9PROT|nr:AI-2E family transporter [Arboricoccus pini]SNB61376.1 Predicted PurR-regulated permease PerM [Arboricoccus pini]
MSTQEPEYLPPKVTDRLPARPSAGHVEVDQHRGPIAAVWLALGVVGFVLLLYLLEHVVLLGFAAILLSVFLGGMSRRLAKATGLNRRVALAVVTIGLLVVVLGFVALVAPAIAEQSVELWHQLPAAWESLTQWLRHYSWMQQYTRDLPSRLESIGNEMFSTASSGLLGAASSTVNAVTETAIVIVLAIYMAAEPQPYISGFVQLFPKHRRTRTYQIMRAMAKNLWRWLLGQFASMAIIGATTGVGLWILGIPLALTLGLLAGLFTFIPTLGPLLALLPALAIASLQGFSTVITVLVLYLGIQAVESNLVTPMIQRRAVELPPALILVAQIVAGVFFGLFGLALATPLTAAIIVLVRKAYIEDVLDDKRKLR